MARKGASKSLSRTAIRRLPCGRAPFAQASRANTGLGPRSDWKQKLRQHVIAKGMKSSEQRSKIAELIISTGGHLDAQALVERVKRQHPGIGAATVYRGIKVLLDAEILKESLTDSHGRVIYELFDHDHHDHIVCMDCGEIFEFHNDKIETLQNEIISEMRFAQVKHRHVIYVKCNYDSRK